MIIKFPKSELNSGLELLASSNRKSAFSFAVFLVVFFSLTAAIFWVVASIGG